MKTGGSGERERERGEKIRGHGVGSFFVTHSIPGRGVNLFACDARLS